MAGTMMVCVMRSALASRTKSAALNGALEAGSEVSHWGAISPLEGFLSGVSPSVDPSSGRVSSGPPESPAAQATAPWTGLAGLLTEDTLRAIDAHPAGGDGGNPLLNPQSSRTESRESRFEDPGRPQPIVPSALVDGGGRGVGPRTDSPSQGWSATASGRQADLASSPLGLAFRSYAPVGPYTVPELDSSGLAASVSGGADGSIAGAFPSDLPAGTTPADRFAFGLESNGTPDQSLAPAPFDVDLSRPTFGVGALGPGYFPAGLTDSQGPYPGLDGGAARSDFGAANAPLDSVHSQGPTQPVEQSSGPAFDLSKTNELLQELLDEVRRGRPSFLPVGDRNRDEND